MPKLYRALLPALCLALIIAGSVNGSETMELQPQWKIQPATAPDVQPDEADWFTSRAVCWRHNSGAGKGTSWEKAARGEIHSLWYEHDFALTPEQAGQQLVLDFIRIEGDAIVWLNGKNLGELLRPGGPLDITGHAVAGNNTLRLFITRDYTGISRGFEEDTLRYLTRGPRARKLPLSRMGLGVTAGVMLKILALPVGVEDALIRSSWREKSLSVDIDLLATQRTQGITAQIRILDQEGKQALSFVAPLDEIPQGRSTQSVSAVWPDAIPWEVEAPYLYKAEIYLLRDGVTVDAGYSTEFGFREIWTEGRQIMLNGHTQRFRVEWSSFGLTENSLPLLKKLGRNMVYFQANPTSWWADWPEIPVHSQETLRMLDHAGIAVFLPVPGVSGIRDNLLTNPQTRQDYRRETEIYLRRYRNHPSILAWTVSMNSFNPRDAIFPLTLGQRSNYTHPQAKTIEEAIRTAKEFDPTRLAYGHADGNLGDMATANFYPNWMPLQEREEYLMTWAEKGDMPWLAVEFDSVYGGDFYKGKRLLMTEYGARLLGDAAYHMESGEALGSTLKLGLGNRGHGNSLQQAVDLLPIYWKLCQLHTVRTDRAWRAWGGQGWHYLSFGIGYGTPPEFTGPRPFDRYACLKEKVTDVPDWVNPAFHYYAEAMQTLLAYIGGHPLHTDKTHAFRSGEIVQKQAVFVWDGAQEKRLNVKWRCLIASKEEAEEVCAAGDFEVTLGRGDISFLPFEFTAPEVGSRTQARLELEVTSPGQSQADAITDSFPLEFFPQPASMRLPEGLAVFNPHGSAMPWLPADVMIQTISTPAQLREHAVRVLLIAPEALTGQAAVPFTHEDIAAGLRVIIMEQKPEAWEGFGLRVLEAGTREVFIREHGAPEIAGLTDKDLAYWRGTPTLLPEMKYYRAPDTQHAPKVTNRHIVASCMLQIPEAVGFVPVLVGEFDLNYSPLLRWQYGKGAIWFSSLSLGFRVGDDPAPTQLAQNIFDAAAQYQNETEAVWYSGGEVGSALLTLLGCAYTQKAPENSALRSLLVLGEDSPLGRAEIDSHLADGGKIMLLPRSEPQLAALGYSGEERLMLKQDAPQHPLFSAVGADMLRSRVPFTYTAVTGGSEALEILAGGLFALDREAHILLCQLDPGALQQMFANPSPEYDNALPSVIKQRQLVARLLTALGASPADSHVQRTAVLTPTKPIYEDLRFWQVIGPFYPDQKATPAQVLDTAYSVEENAILGDTNPNLDYLTPAGVKLDFRKTATAGSDGFVNLLTVLEPEAEAVAYAVREVESDTARIARLRLGVDYFAKVWVNGELVYRLDTGHSSPKPNRHQINVNLRPGINVITLKIFSGSKGFGFWANLSLPGADIGMQDSAEGTGTSLYDPGLHTFDPYEYYFW